MAPSERNRQKPADIADEFPLRTGAARRFEHKPAVSRSIGVSMSRDSTLDQLIFHGVLKDSLVSMDGILSQAKRKEHLHLRSRRKRSGYC
jgi:hypothetical protein